jgi:hypothetical protein
MQLRAPKVDRASQPTLSLKLYRQNGPADLDDGIEAQLNMHLHGDVSFVPDARAWEFWLYTVSAGEWKVHCTGTASLEPQNVRPSDNLSWLRAELLASDVCCRRTVADSVAEDPYHVQCRNSVEVDLVTFRE